MLKEEGASLGVVRGNHDTAKGDEFYDKNGEGARQEVLQLVGGQQVEVGGDFALQLFPAGCALYRNRVLHEKKTHFSDPFMGTLDITRKGL